MTGREKTLHQHGEIRTRTALHANDRDPATASCAPVASSRSHARPRIRRSNGKSMVWSQTRTILVAVEMAYELLELEDTPGVVFAKRSDVHLLQHVEQRGAAVRLHVDERRPRNRQLDSLNDIDRCARQVAIDGQRAVADGAGRQEYPDRHLEHTG